MDSDSCRPNPWWPLIMWAPHNDQWPWWSLDPWIQAPAKFTHSIVVGPLCLFLRVIKRGEKEAKYLGFLDFNAQSESQYNLMRENGKHKKTHKHTPQTYTHKAYKEISLDLFCTLKEAKLFETSKRTKNILQTLSGIRNLGNNAKQ